MMKTTIVDVNGMEEIVVVIMLTHNTAQLVNVLILMLQVQRRAKFLIKQPLIHSTKERLLMKMKFKDLEDTQNLIPTNQKCQL